MSAATTDPHRSPEDVLRDVAALMRKRAGDVCEGPWLADDTEILSRQTNEWVGETSSDPDDHGLGQANAVHIASFASPAVALAVADLLDNAADLYGASESRDLFAWEVAMAYLGGAT